MIQANQQIVLNYFNNFPQRSQHIIANEQPRHSRRTKSNYTSGRLWNSEQSNLLPASLLRWEDLVSQGSRIQMLWDGNTNTLGLDVEASSILRLSCFPKFSVPVNMSALHAQPSHSAVLQPQYLSTLTEAGFPVSVSILWIYTHHGLRKYNQRLICITYNTVKCTSR